MEQVILTCGTAVWINPKLICWAVEFGPETKLWFGSVHDDNYLEVPTAEFKRIIS